MTIDQSLLTKYFPDLTWVDFKTSACAKVPNESRFIDPNLTVLRHENGTFSATLYLNDSIQLCSWIDDESLEGVLESLTEIMIDVRDALLLALPSKGLSDDVFHVPRADPND